MFIAPLYYNVNIFVKKFVYNSDFYAIIRLIEGDLVMADAENKKLIMQDMQDYALITLMKTIRRLELLDEKRNNESEIAKIRRYIGLFLQKNPSEKKDKEDNDTILDKFPEILEIATETDENKANALTKELMNKWRKALLNQITEYKKLSENDCETVILNAEKVYDEVFKPYIEAHNKSRKHKNDPIDRKEFIKSLMSGNIDAKMEEIVCKAKEVVLKKLKERKNDTTSESLFKEEINSIVQGLDISYSISRNTEAVKQANRKVRSYFSKADASSYCKEYFDPDARPATDGSKEDFLKLLGSIAIAGYNQVHLGIKPSEDSFNSFKKIIMKNYPQNSEEVINKSLGVAKNADKETQFKAFADKGASVYTQMLGGFMQLRMDTFPNETPNINIVSSLKKYIDGLQNGAQDIHTLAMLAPEKDNGEDSIKRQLSRDQHVNVDHKIPVASAITLFIKLNPQLGGNLDPNKLSLSQLLELAEKAAPLVDNISNHRQVISKSVNNDLEANGQFVLGREKDNSVLAVRYLLPKIQATVDKMFATDNKKHQRYQEAFSKYSKANAQGINTTDLQLPEAPEIAKARKENTSDKNILDVRVITENALTIEK